MSTAPSLPPPAAPPASARHEFEQECIQLFGEVVDIFGVPKSVGQIYGVLFASAQPLSFSDIVGRLGMSKGSASQGLQLLRSLGAINRIDPGDTRVAGQAYNPVRDYYEPELSLRKLVGGVLQERIAPLASAGSGRFARLQQLTARDGKQDNFLVERVEQLEIWRNRFRTVLPLLGTLFGPKK